MVMRRGAVCIVTFTVGGLDVLGFAVVDVCNGILVCWRRGSLFFRKRGVGFVSKSKKRLRTTYVKWKEQYLYNASLSEWKLKKKSPCQWGAKVALSSLDVIVVQFSANVCLIGYEVTNIGNALKYR